MIEVDNRLLRGFKMVDLFAGIGGFHYAFSSFGAKCIFASEWDVHASKTYFKNFNLLPSGDITKIDEKEIPDHDILCAGFPCQAFSISGKGRGFEDTRGTLFFEVARIINHKKPKVIFLENVKNLARHDGGNTLSVIINTLTELGYEVFTQIVNTSHFGLPQNRERIYIVAFRNDLNSSNFVFPTPENKQVCLLDIIENEPKDAKVIIRNDIEMNKKYASSRSLINEISLLNKPIQIGKVNKGGQGERIYHPLGHAITLSAYGGGVGAKTGLYLIDDCIRKLSPRECARVQGFPDDFIIDDVVTQAYKQFGNSVSIEVLQYIIIEIIKVVNDNE